jgi:Xaa-Pro aminopeptidase
MNGVTCTKNYKGLLRFACNDTLQLRNDLQGFDREQDRIVSFWYVNFPRKTGGMTKMVTFASSLSFGPGMVDWQERINVSRMREERAHRLRAVMKRHRVAACLLEREDNIRYATGLPGDAFMPGLRYCLFFVEHEPVIWEHAGRHELRGEWPWVKPENWRIARCWLGGICGQEAVQETAGVFAAEIAQELQKKGLKGEKLGVTSLDGASLRALGELGIQTFDAQSLLFEARAVKTADEINCLKMIAAITDRAWYKLYEAIKPGVRDIDLTALGHQAMIEAGAEIGGVVPFFSGPSTFERGLAMTDRIIQPGDIVYGDITNFGYLGYKTCLYRTFIVGKKPTQKHKDLYQGLLEKQNAIIGAIKPGATTADAARHFKPASTWGYPDEDHVFTIEIGHGIGLYLYEMPIINRLWSLKHPQAFEVGNTMAIESREGEPGTGVRLEDMIVVTEKGAELLSRFPRDEIIVAGAIG